MIPPQMYHSQQPPQQQILPQPFYGHPQYPQPPQYVPMNYAQGSIPQQVNRKKTYKYFIINFVFLASRK